MAEAVALPADGTAPVFAGVPSLIKDNTDLAGLPTRQGSASTHTVQVSTDGDFTRTFRATGLIPIAKSSLSEFGLTATTEPLCRPATRNPWNPAHSTGGSSGGSAALVAAGVVPVAHANDGGGSIRIPAACYGLVGLKPSRGRLPTIPVAEKMPINIVVEGLLSRTVSDTAAFYAAAELHYKQPTLTPIGLVAEVQCTLTKDRIRIILPIL